MPRQNSMVIRGVMSFFDDIYKTVKRIPVGKVATYGQVARAAGHPRAARQVGWALHANPQPMIIPCHRVVFADGRICEGFAFGGKEVQKAILLGEGVEFFEDYKIDLDRFGVKEL